MAKQFMFGDRPALAGGTDGQNVSKLSGDEFRASLGVTRKGDGNYEMGISNGAAEDEGDVNPYGSNFAQSNEGIGAIGGSGGIEFGGDEDDDDDSGSAVSVMDEEQALQMSVSGWLSKFAVGRSGFFKNWKRRYFTCDGGILAYYENEHTEKPLSTIDLRQQALRLVARPSKHTHPEVTNPMLDFVLIFSEGPSQEERKLLLRAENPDTHMQWCVLLGAFVESVDDPRDGPVHM